MALGTPCPQGMVENAGEGLRGSCAGVGRKVGPFGCWKSKLGGSDLEQKYQWCGGCRLGTTEEPGPPAWGTKDTFRSSSSLLSPPPASLSHRLRSWCLGGTFGSQWSHLLLRFSFPAVVSVQKLLPDTLIHHPPGIWPPPPGRQTASVQTQQGNAGAFPSSR